MAKDIFHDLVRAGLEAEVWTITNDPYRLKFARIRFEIDLAAEKVITATKGTETIAVEIKSFLNPSTVTDFYAALGQFLSYRLVLEQEDSSRKLYLAVPLAIYNEDFFQSQFFELSVKEHNLSLIIYDSLKGGLVKWIN